MIITCAEFADQVLVAIKGSLSINLMAFQGIARFFRIKIASSLQFPQLSMQQQ